MKSFKKAAVSLLDAFSKKKVKEPRTVSPYEFKNLLLEFKKSIKKNVKC